MLVVADSSPFNVLICIGHVDILPRLFQQVAIPTEVARELSHPNTPQVVKDFLSSQPDWLSIHEPAEIELVPKLDLGEQAAVSLARELHADLLLIDERDGRRAAIERKLLIIGTIGVLEQAAGGPEL